MPRSPVGASSSTSTAVDPRLRRPESEPRDEHRDVVGGSLDLGFDRPVGVVPHRSLPTPSSSARRLARSPEPDALDAASHAHAGGARRRFDQCRLVLARGGPGDSGRLGSRRRPRPAPRRATRPSRRARGPREEARLDDRAVPRRSIAVRRLHGVLVGLRQPSSPAWSRVRPFSIRRPGRARLDVRSAVPSSRRAPRQRARRDPRARLVDRPSGGRAAPARSVHLGGLVGSKRNAPCSPPR